MTDEASKGPGRPSDYSEELADIICERPADGESLRSICLNDGMPNKATVFRWLAAHEEFATASSSGNRGEATSLVTILTGDQLPQTTLGISRIAHEKRGAFSRNC